MSFSTNLKKNGQTETTQVYYHSSPFEMALTVLSILLWQAVLPPPKLPASTPVAKRCHWQRYEYGHRQPTDVSCLRSNWRTHIIMSLSKHINSLCIYVYINTIYTYIYIYMGGCQNYGPLLGPRNIKCRVICQAPICIARERKDCGSLRSLQPGILEARFIQKHLEP